MCKSTSADQFQRKLIQGNPGIVGQDMFNLLLALPWHGSPNDIPVCGFAAHGQM